MSDIINDDLPPDLIDGINFHRTQQAIRAIKEVQHAAILRFCEAVTENADVVYCPGHPLYDRSIVNSLQRLRDSLDEAKQAPMKG